MSKTNASSGMNNQLEGYDGFVSSVGSGYPESTLNACGDGISADSRGGGRGHGPWSTSLGGEGNGYNFHNVGNFKYECIA